MEVRDDVWINWEKYNYNEYTYPEKTNTTYAYKFLHEPEEEKMTLTKQYLHQKKNSNDRKAIELGVMDDDGILTSSGKELLLTILLEDKEIRSKFDKVVESLLEEEDGDE